MNNKQEPNLPMSGKVLCLGMPEDYQAKNGTTKTTRIITLEVFHGTYADEIPFEFNQVNMKSLQDIKEGEWVTINFQLRSNKSVKDGRTRYYPRLEGLTCIKG
jgi:hypothetical protein